MHLKKKKFKKQRPPKSQKRKHLKVIEYSFASISF